MKKIILSLFLMLNTAMSFAQCAMCRATLENNFSNGKPGIGAGINVGILYLLMMPYLAAMALGYFWYRSSRSGNSSIPGGVDVR